MVDFFGNSWVNGNQTNGLPEGITIIQSGGGLPGPVTAKDTFSRGQNATIDPNQQGAAIDKRPLSTAKKIKFFCKGFISPFTDPFKSGKSFLIAAGIFIVHAVIVGATGGAAAIPLLALGGITALYHLIKGCGSVQRSKTNQDKGKAIQDIGAGISNILLLGFGAKTALKEGSTLPPESVEKMSKSQAVKESYKQVPVALNDSRKALTSGHAVENTKHFINHQVKETKEKAKVTHQAVKNYKFDSEQSWSRNLKVLFSDLLSALSFNSLLGLIGIKPS